MANRHSLWAEGSLMVVFVCVCLEIGLSGVCWPFACEFFIPPFRYPWRGWWVEWRGCFDSVRCHSPSSHAMLFAPRWIDDLWLAACPRLAAVCHREGPFKPETHSVLSLLAPDSFSNKELLEAVSSCEPCVRPGGYRPHLHTSLALISQWVQGWLLKIPLACVCVCIYIKYI